MKVTALQQSNSNGYHYRVSIVETGFTRQGTSLIYKNEAAVLSNALQES